MGSLQQELLDLRQKIRLPLLLVAIMWLVKIIETITHISFGSLGVLPRDTQTLWHIFTMPFIHGDWQHLLSNSVPLAVLLFLVLQTYEQVASRILAWVYVCSGIGIWLFGRQSYHIGASGVIYGLAFFLFFSGIFRRDLKSMAAALFVALFYGGMVWGLFPLQEGVSWEGHLFGALTGVWCAYYYRHVNPPKRFAWQDEKQDEGKLVEQPYWVLPNTDTNAAVDKPHIITIDEAVTTTAPQSPPQSSPPPPKPSTDRILDWDIKYIYQLKDPPNS